MKSTLRKITAKSVLKDLVIPEDFTVEVIKGFQSFPTADVKPRLRTTYETAILTNTKLRAVIFITVEVSVRGDSTYFGDARGHTCYQDEDGFWHSFDKLGKDDSFRVNLKDDPQPAQVLRREVARIERQRQMVKDSGGWAFLPDIDWKVPMRDIEKHRRELTMHRPVSLLNEVGKGWSLSVLKQSPWARPAAKLAKFLLIKTCYIESI